MDEVVEVTIAGGSGYGNPLERPAEEVAQDVVDGFLSVGRARSEYGVAVDPDGAVQLDATAALREELGLRYREIVDRIPTIDHEGYSLVEPASVVVE